MNEIIFYIVSVVLFLILSYMIWRFIRNETINPKSEEKFCIKKETWNQLILYFVYGIVYIIVGIIQCILLLNYFNNNNFLIFNSIIFVIGIISIYLLFICKESLALFQPYFYCIFIIGLVYGFMDIILLLTAKTTWIILLGIGFPYVHLITLWAFAVYVLSCVSINYYKLKYLDKNRNPNLTCQHRGIIVVLLKNSLQNFSIYGIDTLIEKNRQRQEQFAIYFCYTTDEIKTIFFRPEINKIWIFGHGLFHGINTNEDIFYYCELEGCPPKDEIAQMHCNSYGGKSAAEYLIHPFDERKCIIKKGLRNPVRENNKDIQEFFKNRE